VQAQVTLKPHRITRVPWGGRLLPINALASGKRGLLAAGGNIGPAKSRSRQLLA
jgi:hypothetical protein